MSFARLHKLVAYLLSGLGLLALSLGSEMTEPSLVLILLGYVASFFAEGPILHKPLYTRGWTAVVVAFLIVQIARGIVEAPTLAMAMEFAAVLQISRLFNRREATDYQQIAVLSFLHLIAATVLSTSLSYALLFVGFVIATPWMLALSHLRREIEGNYPVAAEPGDQAQAAIRRVLASKRVVGPGFLVSTALLAIPLFAMTLTIFVAIPRVGKGFLTFQRDQGQRVAGFGNQVELGGFGVIRDDPTVVLRVTPLPAVDEKAPRMVLRMRGTSFDRYDGRRWTRTPSVALPLGKPIPRYRSGSHRYALRRLPDRVHDREYQIVLDHLDEPVLFLPAGTVAVEIPPRVVDGERHRRRLSRGVGLDVRYEDRDGIGLVYSAFVSSQREDSVLLPFRDEPMAQYLEVPEGHERVAALARRITEGAESDLDKARLIQRFLNSGDFKYTLRQPHVGNRPPLEVFLFDEKRGHCEYYSSAMAIMLRTLGVPTRNVTGFVGGRYNPYGGYYALRQGDAHSWVEALIEGRGWVTFDPTPPTRATLGPQQNLWADVNALFDAVRTRWVTKVVGYDLEVQRSMVMRLYRFLRSRRGTSADDASADGDQLSWDGVWAYGRACLVLLLLVGATVVYLRVRRRPRGKKTRALSPPAAEAVRLYGALERALDRRGRPRPSGRTPFEHATALREEGFPQSAEVALVTERYVEVRFGEADLTTAELAELRAMVKRVHRGKPAPRAPGSSPDYS